MIDIPAAKCKYYKQQIIVDIPGPFIMAASNVDGYYSVKVSKTRKSRTTGYKSQNHAINGFCQQIARHTGNTFPAVKTHMKIIAIDRGWPFETLPDGGIAPISEGDPRISTIEAGYLIDTIKQFADEWGIPLQEE